MFDPPTPNSCGHEALGYPEQAHIVPRSYHTALLTRHVLPQSPPMPRQSQPMDRPSLPTDPHLNLDPQSHLTDQLNPRTDPLCYDQCDQIGRFIALWATF